eukprot:767307-Hanusia_phi.AAC.4
MGREAVVDQHPLSIKRSSSEPCCGLHGSASDDPLVVLSMISSSMSMRVLKNGCQGGRSTDPRLANIATDVT